MATHVSSATADVESTRNPAQAEFFRTSWVLFLVALVLGVSVFWAFEALPFQDLPAHAGLIAMRHRLPASAFEQRYFVMAPHVGPYSLFRFLGEEASLVLGPLGAVRLLASLPVIATPAAMLFARWRLHKDTTATYGLLGISLSFGLMTLFGFASYLLGVPVLLVGLTLWLELLTAVDAGEPTFRRELAVLAYTPLIFVAHGHAFVLFLILAGVACVATGRRARRLVRVRALVPALLLAGWVAWVERAGAIPAGSAPLPATLAPRFQGLLDKLSLLGTPTLMTRSGIDILIGIIVWAFIVATVVASWRGSRAESAVDGACIEHSRALYAGAAVLMAIFLALPHSIGWFGFVDGRLVPIIMILSLLAVRPLALPVGLRHAIERSAPVIAFAMTLLALVASYRFQREAAGYKEVLSHVPAESRLLNLPLEPNSDVFTAHPFIHYDKLVMVERPVVVSDVWFHQGTALYPTPENPSLRLPDSYSESNLLAIDWPAYALEDWDYVLIRTRPDGQAPHVPNRLMLEEHRGGWWLYKRR